MSRNAGKLTLQYGPEAIRYGITAQEIADIARMQIGNEWEKGGCTSFVYAASFLAGAPLYGNLPYSIVGGDATQIGSITRDAAITSSNPFGYVYVIPREDGIHDMPGDLFDTVWNSSNNGEGSSHAEMVAKVQVGDIVRVETRADASFTYVNNNGVTVGVNHSFIVSRIDESNNIFVVDQGLTTPPTSSGFTRQIEERPIDTILTRYGSPDGTYKWLQVSRLNETASSSLDGQLQGASSGDWSSIQAGYDSSSIETEVIDSTEGVVGNLFVTGSEASIEIVANDIPVSATVQTWISSATLWVEDLLQQALFGNTAHAAELNQVQKLRVYVEDTSGDEVASRRYAVENGQVTHVEVQMHAVEARNGDAVHADNDLQMRYELVNNDVVDHTSARVTFYRDSNGNGQWDTGDAWLDSESAGTLWSGEQDTESEWVAAAADLSAGDHVIFSVFTSDQETGRVLSTDTITVVKPPEIQNLVVDHGGIVTADDDLRVDYNLVETHGVTHTGARVWFYHDVDGDGNLDTSDVLMDSESAGTLYANENDSEGETIAWAWDNLSDGDYEGLAVFTSDQITDGVVLDQFDFTVSSSGGPDIDLRLKDVSARDYSLQDGSDLRTDFTVVNDGSVSTEGYSERTGIFLSRDNHFDFNEDVMVDYDTHGTLYAGEHDQEYERTYYEQLVEEGTGVWWVFHMVDPHNLIAETNEANNVSDGFAILV